MTAASIGVGGALSALQQSAGEMSLRVWMELNREALVAEWGGRRMDWQALCSWFGKVGLTNAKGRPPSVQCAKIIWYRTGKFLKEQREREAAQKEAFATAVEARRESAHLKRLQAEAAMKEAAFARAGAERELKIRQIAERGFPPTPATPSSSPVSEAVPTMPAQVSSETTGQDDMPDVVIGQIKRPVKMLEAAPRYGEDRFKPLPPSYVGPRPAGMPENLPLEALTPLDATGMTPDGRVDFEQIPGLPRMSFFERQSDWARACVPMIEAVPLEKRSLVLKGMLPLVKGYARNF